MPRRSAADLAVVRVDAGSARLRPPPELGDEERDVWISIVGACALKHFERSDIPLLARYCEAVVLAKRARLRLPARGW